MTSTSSMSESSTLFNISNRSPHNTDFNNGTNDPSNGVDVRRSSLQYILNQNQDINSSYDYWDFQNNEGDDDDDDVNYSDNYNNDNYYDSYYPDSHFDSTHQFNSEYFQYSSPIQQYSSHGKLVPPPPPPMEMDILENDQILSSDEFNSIFESFATVVEGHNQNNNNNINYFNEDGGLKGVNYSNGLLEDEQLAKALSVIAMI